MVFRPKEVVAMQVLFFVVGLVMIYFAVVEFKRRGPKQLSPWSYLAFGLGNVGVAPGVLIPVGVVLWLVELFRNRSSQRFR